VAASAGGGSVALNWLYALSRFGERRPRIDVCQRSPMTRQVGIDHPTPLTDIESRSRCIDGGGWGTDVTPPSEGTRPSRADLPEMLTVVFWALLARALANSVDVAECVSQSASY
jgi:hypothetical protein